jgi:hypothetical protein
VRQYLRPGNCWHQRRAAFDNLGCGGRSNVEVLVAVFSGAAEHDRVAARHHVGRLPGIALIKHPFLDADLLNDDDLAADRLHAAVVGELARAEAGAVHRDVDIGGCRIEVLDRLPGDRDAESNDPVE